MLQELLPTDAGHDLAASVVSMCSCPRPFIEAISASFDLISLYGVFLSRRLLCSGFLFDYDL